MKYFVLSLFSINILSAPIKGRLFNDVKCLSKENGQLFISEKKKLIYQIEIPANGSFQVELPEGVYDFNYIMKNGCSTNQKLKHAKKEQTISLKVRK